MLKDNGRFIQHLYGSYAIPSILALLAAAISTLINTTMAGAYYGEVGLSVVGVFMPLFFFFYTLGALIGAGGANASNKAMSMDEHKPVKNYFTISTIYVVVVGLFSIFMILCFSEKILFVLSGSSNITTSIERYYIYTVLSGILTMYIYVLMNFARIDGKPRASVYIFIAMTIVNLVTNFILIKIFHMGLESVAIGAGIGSVVGVIVGLYCIFTKGGHVSFVRPHNIISSTGQILLFGGPMALNNFYNFLRVIIINFIFLSINEPECIAIFAVVNTFSTFIMSVSSGLGQSIVPLVAVFNNKLDIESVKLVAKSAIKIGNVVFFIIASAIVILNKFMCDYFSIGSPDIVNVSQYAMICFGISLIFAVNNVVLSFYYIAINRIWLAHLINFCRGFLFVLIFSFYWAREFGSKGIFGSLIIAEVLTLIIIIIIAKTIVIKSFNNDYVGSFLLTLNKNILHDVEYLAFSANYDDGKIVKAAESVYNFCNNTGLEPKKSLLLRKSVEEILEAIKNKRDIIKHANTYLKNISLRVYIKEDVQFITFMYHGELYNPMDDVKILCEEEGENDQSSVKLKDVKFSDVLGVNNLSIFI